MKRKPHSASLVLLLVCIFTFWWGISVLTQSTIPVPSANPQQTSQSVPVTNTLPNPILVHESVAGGTHTYSGTFAPRSACDSFGSGIRYSSEDNGHVSILLMTKPPVTACAQAASTTTDEPFVVSIKLTAGSNPVFDGVLVDGAKVPTQLQEGN